MNVACDVGLFCVYLSMLFADLLPTEATQGQTEDGPVTTAEPLALLRKMGKEGVYNTLCVHHVQTYLMFCIQSCPEM